MADELTFPEADITGALNYLKYHDPEHATREDAIKLLSDLKQGYHKMAHNDPEELLRLKKQIDKS